jgi:hypothetical protein
MQTIAPASSAADVNKLSRAIQPIPKSARTITVPASRRLRSIRIRGAGVRRADFRRQRGVHQDTRTGRPLHPSVIATGGDA